MLPLGRPDRVNQEILQFAGGLGAPSVVAAAAEPPRERSLAQRVRDRAHQIGTHVLSALRFHRST
jgi:hypothetical protein